MKLSEIFQSIQGEGNTQGVNSLFIRFSGCSLRCVDCDSKYTWKKDQLEVFDVDVYEKIKKSNTKHIVFTGGEPLLHLNRILEIIHEFPLHTYEIETNGVIKHNNNKLDVLFKILNYDVQFNISPKGNFKQEVPLNTEPNLINLLQNVGTYIVKFLFDSTEDFNYIKNVVKQYNINNDRIWVQPKAITSEDAKNLITKHFDYIINEGWNISLRSHVFLFGNNKGV
jgi:7-carboxy-7-deazaguanine synthase